MSILIVGEHPTLNEAGRPFTNGLWRFFKVKLRQAGIDTDNVDWLDVLPIPAASMFSFVQKGKPGSVPGLPSVAKGLYIRGEFAPEIERFYETVRRLSPNLIIAVGDLPTIVLTHQNAMMFARGRVTTTVAAAGGTKVLPVFHPRAVQADIKQEPILLMDLQKANRQSKLPELRRPRRFLHLRPSLDDLEGFWQEYIAHASRLSIDIETKGDIITCVGIAPSPDRCIVVPFFDEEKPSGNYWETFREERIAWDYIYRCCNTPGKAVFGQNFSYDVQYLLRKMGIPVSSWRDDTMILHHALQPEMQKGLGFLASIYTEELAWKFMHKRRAADRGGKKEDN